MAAPDPHILRINLFKRQDAKFKLDAHFISWLVTSGRYVIILVEIVVIGAFLLRFKLDSDLASINHEINDSAIPYLKSLQKDEKEIRQTQLQLTTIRAVRAQNPAYPEVVSLIAKSLPTTIKLSKLTFDKTTAAPKVLISISGSTPSTIEVTALIKALEKEPTFKEVALSNFSTSDTGTEFTVTAQLPPKGGI